MMHRLLRRCAAVAALLCLADATFAQGPAPAVLYRLDAPSFVTEGCYGMCDCLLASNENLFGTMTVQFDHSDPAYFDHYRISNINWVIDDGPTERRVTGRGTYRFGGHLALMSQMTLHLSIDGTPTVLYSENLRPAVATIPDIAGDINFAGFLCYDRVFTVRASPVPANEIQPYGLHRSGYKIGCLPPCTCPISKSRLVGTFGFVDLGAATNPAHGHYALVDIGWSTIPPPAPPDRTFHGFGLYSVRTDTTQHRLTCELTDGNNLTQSFDSAFVTGGTTFPPRIDIDMALNGFNCFDQVFLVHARP